MRSDFKNKLATIAGPGLPPNVTPCFDFNNGSCNQSFVCSNTAIHICAICSKVFGVGIHHPAEKCETLKGLDTGLL